MSVMFCYIDPFVIKQKVMEQSDNGLYHLKAEVPLVDIIRYLAAESKNYDKITLSANSIQMANGYASQIRDYIYLNYGLNKYDIEVI